MALSKTSPGRTVVPAPATVPPKASGPPTAAEVDTFMALVAAEQAKGLSLDAARDAIWRNPQTQALASRVAGDPLGVKPGADPYATEWRAEVARVARLYPDKPAWFAVAKVAHDCPELRLCVFESDPVAKAHSIAAYEVERGTDLVTAYRLAQQYGGVDLTTL